MLENGGLPFVNWLQSCIIDLRGRAFSCRIEKLDTKYCSKSMFLLQIYPKEEQYILKIGVANSKDSLNDCNNDKNTSENVMYESGFAVGINNIRRVMQAIVKDDTECRTSYQHIAQKIMTNIASNFSYKVWPKLSSTINDCAEVTTTHDKLNDKQLISIQKMDEYFTEIDSDHHYALTDSDLHICQTVFVNLLLDDDPMNERIDELNQQELKGYLKQTLNCYKDLVDKRNDVIENADDLETVKKLVIPEVKALVTKDFFKESSVTNPFIKDTHEKKYKSVKELRKDIRNGLVQIAGIDDNFLIEKKILQTSVGFCSSVENDCLTVFSEKHFTMGLLKTWDAYDQICGTQNTLDSL